MQTADYDFPLPEGCIAERPAGRRDESRLFVLRADGRSEHRRFSDLGEYLSAGDLLILNDSRVIPARLDAKTSSGQVLELLFVRELEPGDWSILVKGKYRGRVSVGDTEAEMLPGMKIRFPKGTDVRGLLQRSGLMPLPPYIKRHADAEDRITYQTVYARQEGSIAAPTAGLHFTPSLLEDIERKGVSLRYVTLHVGTGTFRPVKAARIEDHVMDEESFAFDHSLVDEIAETRARGSRVIFVGTTTTRTIEGYLSGRCSLSSENGTIRGATNIFISEGHSFRGPNTLITNFHLPRSTPLMLAAAFAGREKLLSAYEEAIRLGYRFFSYGDAMLLL